MKSGNYPKPRRALRTFGDEAQMLQSSVIYASELRMNAMDLVFPNYRIAYLISGSGEYSTAAGKQRLHPGDLLQRFPNRLHSLRRKDDGQWREFSLVLPLSLYTALRELSLIDDQREVLHPGVTPALLSHIDDFQSEFSRVISRDASAALIMAQQMLEHLFGLDRMHQARDPDAAKLQQACERLRDRSGARLRLETIARQCGMGYEKFRKAFALRYGLSPKQYQLKHRIDLARRLLIERRLSIKQIAAELGYSEVANFTQHFRQATGETPAAYRRAE